MNRRSEVSANKDLTEELDKPVVIKLKKKKIYGRLKENIRATDLAEMRLLSSSNRGVNNHYVLYRCFHLSPNMLESNECKYM